jgi:short-subunit dehydrogenase
MSQQKWVLITGATSGIGLSTAILLALEGFRVIATGRSEQKFESLMKATDKAQVTIRRVIADVTDDASIANLKEEVLTLTNGYGVDILINNAGYAEGGALEEIPLARLRKQFETNVIGLVAVTQAFVPMMRQRTAGVIVNVSSVVGKVTIPLMGAYTATKHAVESLSDALRMELASAGIRVVTIAPGSIQTHFGNTLIETVESWLETESPYHDAYQKFMRDRRNDRGAEPIVIAKAILEAIRSERPKPRYAVPMDSKLMPVAKTVLPTRTLDKVISNVVLGKRKA